MREREREREERIKRFWGTGAIAGKRGNAEQRETGVCREMKRNWRVFGDPMPILWSQGGHGHVVVGPMSYEGVGHSIGSVGQP